MELIHFIRPWWLLTFIPAVLFVVLLFRHSGKSNSWAKHCDAHLLEHVLVGRESKAKKSLLPLFFLLIWSVGIFALAGSVWKYKDVSVYQKNISRVIALDVSQSMDTTDVAPSRLERAKYKIFDILRKITEGQTAMIVFSSESFIVSPLTSDSKTILNLVSVLNTSIVPVQGHDMTKALDSSSELLSQGGAGKGQIIIITDSSPTDNAIAEAKKLAERDIKTDVYAIGTPKGGVAEAEDGSYRKDDSGNIKYFGVDLERMQALAKAGNGKLITLTANNNDVNALIADIQNNDSQAKKSQQSTANIFWQDEGVYFIWVLALLSAFVFRRGFLEKICR
jgi:Ca-activated chloride channel family protein